MQPLVQLPVLLPAGLLTWLHVRTQKWYPLHPKFTDNLNEQEVKRDDLMHLEADGLLSCTPA
jgi:hypothetical protein